MAITWSRLHEIRGLDPRPLTYADIVAAVDEQTGEEAGLDWKGQRRTDEAAKVELAKDVAAMANSGGGVIVFGVEETGKGPAKKINVSPVELAEQAEQQVRGTVSSRVRPMISGIEVDQVPDPDDAGRGFVTVSVPASPEAPHFYEKGNDAPAAPWRNGSHTENMRESQIERAYRDRFNRQTDIETRLKEVAASVARRLDFDEKRSRRWIVTVAAPTSTPPLGGVAPSLETLPRVLQAARTNLGKMMESSIKRQQVGLSEQMYGYIRLPDRPRLGLRRWIFQSEHGDRKPTKTSQTYAELHFTGVAVLACPVAIDDEPDEERPSIGAPWVEEACATAVCLTKAWLDALRIGGTIAFRTDIVRDPTDHQPFWIHSRRSPGAFRSKIPYWAVTVVETENVETLMPAPFTADSRRETAQELAQGILHQFNHGWSEHFEHPDNTI